MEEGVCKIVEETSIETFDEGPQRRTSRRYLAVECT